MVRRFWLRVPSDKEVQNDDDDDKTRRQGEGGGSDGFRTIGKSDDGLDMMGLMTIQGGTKVG